MGKETKPSPLTVAAAIAAVLSQPTPLPVNSHLCGSDNYNIWEIQMRALVGSDTYAVLTGSYSRPTDAAAAAVWDRMNEFTISSIIISCHLSVIQHVAACEHSASAYWKALRNVFQLTTTLPAPPTPAAALAKCDGVEAWLSMLNPTTTIPSRTATLDSGATHSMVGDPSLFANLRRCTPSIFIRLATGCLVTLDNAFCVPGISANLISASQLYDLHGITCSFGKSATLVKHGKVIATGSRVANNLYRLNVRSVKTLARSKDVTGLEMRGDGVDPHSSCNTCHIARSSRLPFPLSERQTTERLELVHSDLLAINVSSIGGRRYVVTFIDDYSRMLWVEPLSRKSDALAAFQRFKAAAENKLGQLIRRFRSDNGSEFTSSAFSDFLSEHGIIRETPPPYSPQSNGVAERVNRSIVEGVIALLSQSGAPKELWAEALQAFVFTKNRSPHAALVTGVPLSIWHRCPVRVDMLPTSISAMPSVLFVALCSPARRK
ncbi:hypothetical protein JCM6882_006533 [Rhodosporidiobolus microsporus]